ncbi:uncharacterized protein [Clytia hemisphaerica]|uniref:uncharacterized protein n=1 Tax=Clytia hemisphaerica TaxID=252671 RepID=UPI0034D3A379
MKVFIVYFIITVTSAIYLTENPIQIRDDQMTSVYSIPGTKARSKIECTLLCMNKKFKAALMVNGTKCYCSNEETSWSQQENGATSSTLIKKFCLDETIENDGSSEEKPAKSCKSLKASYPSLGSGFYWIQMDIPVQVYCDQDFDQGGWMLATNFSISQSEQSAVTIPTYSQNMADLLNVNNGKYIADPRMLTQISRHINIKQFRIYCIKDRIGHTLHFKSQLNLYGKSFRDSIFDFTIKWLNATSKPQCTQFLQKYPEDNSNLMADCSRWTIPHDEDINSGNTLYRHILYVETNYHVQLIPGRIECDDTELVDDNNNAGIWQYYVR